MFYPRVRVPKSEENEKVNNDRLQKLLDIGLENIQRVNQLSREAYEDGKSDESAQYSDLCGDWYDRLTGRQWGG